MSDYIFPASLKPIVNKGYSLTTGGNITRVSPQGGLPRQSRDTYYDAVPINVALVLTAFQRQIFRAFIQKIDGGASSFQMNHDTGNGIEPHNVLITSDINDQTDNGVYWNITFTATAERTSVQDESCVGDFLLDTEPCYGSKVIFFLSEYEKRLTTYPFINNLPSAS